MEAVAAEDAAAFLVRREDGEAKVAPPVMPTAEAAGIPGVASRGAGWPPDIHLNGALCRL